MPMRRMRVMCRQEEAAHRIAWAAVKRTYVKSGEQLGSRATRNTP